MKRYKLSVTCEVYFDAESKEKALDKWEEMNIRFEDAKGKRCDFEVWDFDIIEMDKL